jgi:hypothetical protein
MSESSIWLPPHMRRKAGLGSDTLIYFERIGDGRLIIPPVPWAETPVCRLPKPHPRDRNCLCGYIRKEANTVAELERVSKRKEAQRRQDFAAIDEPHQRRVAAKMAEVRSRLHHRMQTTHSQYEKDFIRAALKALERGEVNWAPRQIEGHLQIESTEAKVGK